MEDLANHFCDDFAGFSVRSSRVELLEDDLVRALIIKLNS